MSPTLKPGKCRQASPFTPSKEVVAIRDVRKQGKEGGGGCLREYSHTRMAVHEDEKELKGR